MSLIPVDTAHDVVVIIPTVADPQVLVPTVLRIAEAAQAEPLVRQALVLVINTPDPAKADEAVQICADICGKAGLDLAIWRENQPIGFGAANNRGTVLALQTWGGLPELVVYHNDDAHVAPGWLSGMLDALRTPYVSTYGESWDFEGPPEGRIRHAVEKFGRVGLVGPVSNLVAGIQQVREVIMGPGRVARWNGNTDGFADVVRQRYHGQRVSADFLSGFCVGISREAMEDLFLQVGGNGQLYSIHPQDLLEAMLAGDMPQFILRAPAEATEDGSTPPPGAGSTEAICKAGGPCVGGLIGPWDEVTYPIAGYEDNDLMVRAELAGWRAVVAADVFVGHIGHQTFDRLFPDALRGMRNRTAFYRRWERLTRPARELKVVGVYRLRFEVGHDVHMMRQSLQRVAQICDGVAIVLTANPLDVKDDVRWPLEQRHLNDLDRDLLQACSGASMEQVAAALAVWVARVAAATPGGRWGQVAEDPAMAARIAVEVWNGPFNERDERNRSHAMGEALGADWLISLDGDEVLENRFSRPLLERLIRHPDPMVRSLDVSFLNHWESQRQVREDRPWGDGGTYTGGMHGFRLWRLPRSLDGSLRPHAARRILAGTSNGLHCGNSPDHDLMAKRVASLRIRHFGYCRDEDRHRKHARYLEQDPEPNADLTGNDNHDKYGHIIAWEKMLSSPYSPINGIGLHVLVYGGESAYELARLLDEIHTLVDRVVLVWTDPWNEEDKWWLAEPDPEIKARVDHRDAERAARSAWMAERAAEGVVFDKDNTPKEPHRLRTSQRPGVGRIMGGSPPRTGPSPEMIEISALFGAEWVHQPLQDDLGSARNAGLEALQADSAMIGWALFLDLDERFSDGFRDALALRRMAECSDAHGWLFTFLNHHKDESPSRSESIRMARLLPSLKLRGRVHETYDHVFDQIAESRVDVHIRPAPFTMQHYGLALDDAGMDRKLARYARLLQLELMENPHNSAAWVALGLHYLNHGHTQHGQESLERGVICSGQGYLAYRELALYHMRRAKALFAEAMLRSSPAHEWHRANVQMNRMLQEGIPDLPILGSVRSGQPVPPPDDLPPFYLPQDVAGLGLDPASLGLPGALGTRGVVSPISPAPRRSPEATQTQDGPSLAELQARHRAITEQADREQPDRVAQLEAALALFGVAPEAAPEATGPEGTPETEGTDPVATEVPAPAGKG